MKVLSKDTELYCNFGKAILVAIIFLLPLGCASYHAKPSGFLDKPGTLSSSPDAPGRMMYQNRAFDLGEYNSVLIEPVVWFPEPGAGDDVSEEEARSLADYFGASLSNSLKRDYAITHKSSPATIRVRAAISKLDPTSIALNIVSTLLLLWPMDRGSVMAEVEFLDSVTDERIGAIIFSQKGDLSEFKKSFSRFGRAKHVLNGLSEEIALFLKNGKSNQERYSSN